MMAFYDDGVLYSLSQNSMHQSDLTITESCRLDRKHVREFVDPRRLKRRQLQTKIKNVPALLRREARREIGFEFFYEQRHAFVPPAPVTNRIFNRYFFGARAVREKDLNRIGNRALIRFEIIMGVARIFDYDHLFAQAVNPRIASDLVRVVIGRKLSEDQADRRHVLQAMISVRRIVQRSA